MPPDGGMRIHLCLRQLEGCDVIGSILVFLFGPFHDSYLFDYSSTSFKHFASLVSFPRNSRNFNSVARFRVSRFTIDMTRIL